MIPNTGFHNVGKDEQCKRKLANALSSFLLLWYNASCNIRHAEIQGCWRRQPHKATTSSVNSKIGCGSFEDLCSQEGHLLFCLWPPHERLTKEGANSPRHPHLPSLSVFKVSPFPHTHENGKLSHMLSFDSTTKSMRGTIAYYRTWALYGPPWWQWRFNKFFA